MKRNSTRHVCIVGHRGACGLAPENTLASFAAAIESGCCRTEFDVRLTLDQVPVVIHDATVDRTTDGSGLVSDLSWTDLSELRCDGGQRIPTLREAVETCRGRIALQVELKTCAAARPVVEELAAADLLSSAVVSSFDALALTEVRRQAPEIRLLLLAKKPTTELWCCVRDLEPDCVGLEGSHLNSTAIARARQEDLAVYAFHVHETSLARRLVLSGITEIGTPNPQHLAAFCLGSDQGSCPSLEELSSAA